MQSPQPPVLVAAACLALATFCLAGSEVPCSEKDFECDNGRCLSPSVRCDRVFDCADMTDEVRCKGICLPGNFLCNDTSCIPENKRCDGFKDCSDDELNCVGCRDKEFQCKDKTCLPIRMRCNGHYECKDESDEDNCPKVNCPEEDGNCGNKKYYTTSQPTKEHKIETQYVLRSGFIYSKANTIFPQHIYFTSIVLVSYIINLAWYD